MSVIPLIALLAIATATVPQHSVDPGLVPAAEAFAC